MDNLNQYDMIKRKILQKCSIKPKRMFFWNNLLKQNIYREIVTKFNTWKEDSNLL